MGMPEIESWIASTSSVSGDLDDFRDGSARPEWRRARVLSDWDTALEIAQRQLLTSSTKVRIQFLREELLVLAQHGDLSLSQILDIFQLLTQTYPRYVDAKSREAVEAVGVELVRQDELRWASEGEGETKLGVSEQILGWLSHEVVRISRRSSSHTFSDMYVLLSWCSGLYVACLECNPEFSNDHTWGVLIGTMAALLDMLLDESTRTKPAIKRSALVRTRRALRSCPEKLPAVMRTLLSRAKSAPSLAIVPLLGLAIDVTLRLKNVKDTSLKQLDSALKAEILSFYENAVIMSRVPVPKHISSALHDYVATYVSEEELNSTILPTLEKALLRSPEYALNVVSDLVSAYSSRIDGILFQRILTPTLNSAKSSNPLVRTNATGLFRALVMKTDSMADQELAINELLALPKAGKSSGPDHRIVLYNMLSSIAPSSSVSVLLVEVLPPLIAKETHDPAVANLATALIPHLVFCLRADSPLPSDTIALIAKELNGKKPAIRKALSSVIGDTLWQLADLSGSAVALAQALLPSFEVNLKTVSANPLNAIATPVEGYIAAAIILGPLSRSGKFEDFISHNSAIHSLVSSGAKPSFLLWDRVYQKLTGIEDEMWLLRASEAALFFFQDDLIHSEQLRGSIGMVFLHLAVESQHTQIRRDTITSLEAAMPKLPVLLSKVVSAALSTYLRKEENNSTKAVVADDIEPAVNRSSRLSAFALTCASVGDIDHKTKMELLVRLVVITHHPSLGTEMRQVWIDLCQNSAVNPHDLVCANLNELVHTVLSASDPQSKSYSIGFARASYRAVSTLAFVAPEVVLPRIVEQLHADINADEINSLTDQDLGIWATPEGTAYVDVLASKTIAAPVNKGKGYKDAQWEAEVRKSIASKKTTGSNLSKQDLALVQAQLEKEVIVRLRVAAVKARLERGLSLVHSLVASGADELRSHITSIASLLLAGGFGKGVALVGIAPFERYLELSTSCSDRLDTFKQWVGVATLRSLGVCGIPEEMQAEPINALVTRVLYRLRFLSEQVPFDVATFSYASPLLSQVLVKGGIGLTDIDDPLEQVALALDVIKYHCGEFSNPSFPRISTMKDLLYVIKHQPKLAKDASTALIDLGQAIYLTATRDEIAVLLGGTLMQEVYVRNSCLQTLQPFDLTDLDWSAELWIASHDDDEQNARLAIHVWDDNGFDVPESYLHDLLKYLEHDNAYVRSSSATALAEAVSHWPQSITNTLATLYGVYRVKAKLLAPEFDDYGMVIAESLDRADPWPVRLAISRALELLAPAFTEEDIEPLFKFLIHDEALGDRHPDVRRGMLNAGTVVIDLHGPVRLAGLIAMFEEQLSSTAAPNEAADHIKEAVVILFGRVARHLDPSDARVPQIVQRLVESLKTPAEQVQIAVSDCLSPLVQILQTPVAELVDHLFSELTDSPKYGARRGAAYGLAGVIKGAGIAAMQEFKIIERLRAATEDKKRYEPRQGAMFAFETFSNTLGRLFEPYIIHILPLLLTSFGDATPDVREATHDAARVIMANMSGYGIKTMLPDLLAGLDEKQWRTKKGSIELLGMMAYCAPRQLSQSLPVVIPRLTGVLTDSHAQVRAAANKSLKQFGEVISNPEIQSLVPVFLKALVDPAKTPNALTALLKTSFMHYIDHSSLALVVPIIERGLRERGADTKKKAAQIVGNLASLTDSKDFVPYLSRLLPMVHVVLVDPVPEARATAAKSLGTLVERLGEVHFPDLVPGLLRTLKTDTSGVDRQGAAQGLSEVLSGLGMERMEGLLPDIIANAQSPRSTVREGFMSLLVFLPATFGTRFQPHLPKIITPILKGLSDTEEYVREAAMRAGRMIVTNYSSRAIDLLLPELERGMFDPGWRIRQSSITLVGELLFKVSGISGKAEIEEDEEVVAETTLTESSRRALVEVLGIERRDRILSALYLARQDAVNVVRQSSLHIWKALVHNTPRTVREILPELTAQVILMLSSNEIDRQETAGRTVVELCRKSGDKVLGEVITILRKNSTSPDAQTREGVCLALCELMESTNDAQRDGYEDEIIAMVRASLVDDEANVRTAAAKAFDILQENIGAKAIDQTIPTLLEALRQPGQSSGTALQALKEVMTVRASMVFPVLIPTLTAIPMSVFNARALASLVTVAGTALSKRLSVILSALVKVIESPDLEEQGELKSAVDEAMRALLASISDPEGLNTLMLLLLGWARHDTVNRRVSACNIFAIFCEESELDISIYRIDWIRQLVTLLDDEQVSVHTAAWHAFDVFVKYTPKDELESLVVPLRRTLESTGGPGIPVLGLSLPKGAAPMVPIIIAGLTTGSNEQREQAAYAIGDLVERTTADSIKPFVVPFTGPLIRVATQATTYPPAVKTAILSALATMLARIPAFVRPFFPQLQRTFVKSASDGASVVVRTRAVQALGLLMRHQTRVDPVVTELIAGARGGDEAVAGSLVLGLAYVVHNAGSNVGEKAREACAELIVDSFKESHDEHYFESVATLFLAITSYPELVKPIITSYLVGGTPPSILSSQCIVTVLSPPDDFEPSDPYAPNVFQKLGLMRIVAQKVKESIANDRPPIARPAREAREALKSLDDESLAGMF